MVAGLIRGSARLRKHGRRTSALLRIAVWQKSPWRKRGRRRCRFARAKGPAPQACGFRLLLYLYPACFARTARDGGRLSDPVARCPRRGALPRVVRRFSRGHECTGRPLRFQHLCYTVAPSIARTACAHRDPPAARRRHMAAVTSPIWLALTLALPTPAPWSGSVKDRAKAGDGAA